MPDGGDTQVRVARRRARRPWRESTTHALAARNRELARANADLENVLESLGLPLATLDVPLRTAARAVGVPLYQP